LNRPFVSRVPKTPALPYEKQASQNVNVYP